MIKSKKSLIEALKAKKPLTFETTRNRENAGVIGLIRRPGSIVQTNAFTIENPKNGGFVNSWVYLNEIDVSNNTIKYKNFDIEIKIHE
jgi:hypothetical protein